MEETVKNSLVFAKLMSTSHSIQLALFVQTLVQVKIKLFWLGIKLSVINNLICFGNGIPTFKHCITIKFISLTELIHLNQSFHVRWYYKIWVTKSS